MRLGTGHPRRSLLACLLAAAACSVEAPEETDLLLDEGDVERTLAGPGCTAGEACTGSGAVEATANRVGSNAASLSGLVQTFTATQAGTPTHVRFVVRPLRRYALPVGATAPKLNVRLFAVSSAAVTALPATPIATTSATLGTRGTDLSGTVELALTATGALEQNGLYALEFAVDSLPAGATGAALLGIGAYPNADYAPAGAAFRMSARWSGSAFVPGAFLPLANAEVAVAVKSEPPPTTFPPELCSGTHFSESTLVTFPATQNGDGSPTSQLGLGEGLENVQAVAVDRARRELYVHDANPPVEIKVFSIPPGQPATLLRTISGPSTQLTQYPSELHYDPANQEIWATSGNNLIAFPRTASGNVAPVRTISNALEMGHCGGIGVDPVANEVFTATYLGARVFSRATGALLRTFSPNIWGGFYVNAMAIDLVNQEVLIAGSNAEILYYPFNASGEGVQPPRKLTLGSGNIMGVDVDTALNLVAVASNDGRLRVYDRSAVGNTSPLYTIQGPSTQLGNVQHVAFCHPAPSN